MPDTINPNNKDESSFNFKEYVDKEVTKKITVAVLICIALIVISLIFNIYLKDYTKIFNLVLGIIGAFLLSLISLKKATQIANISSAFWDYNLAFANDLIQSSFYSAIGTFMLVLSLIMNYIL